MSNINVTPGTGKTVGTETIGSVDYGQVKILDGRIGSVTGMTVNTDGSAQVSVIGTVTVNPHSVSGTVGASIIGSIPVTLSSGITVNSVIGAVSLYAQPTAFVSGSPSVITGTTSVLVLSAPSASLRNHATHILVSNNAAVSTAVNIIDQGTVIYAGFAAASGGGFSATLPTPLRQPSSGVGLYVQTPTQASVLVAISGFTA